jgi:hypothetical protein
MFELFLKKELYAKTISRRKTARMETTRRTVGGD